MRAEHVRPMTAYIGLCAAASFVLAQNLVGGPLRSPVDVARAGQPALLIAETFRLGVRQVTEVGTDIAVSVGGAAVRAAPAGVGAGTTAPVAATVAVVDAVTTPTRSGVALPVTVSTPAKHPVTAPVTAPAAKHPAAAPAASKTAGKGNHGAPASRATDYRITGSSSAGKTSKATTSGKSTKATKSTGVTRVSGAGATHAKGPKAHR